MVSKEDCINYYEIYFYEPNETLTDVITKERDDGGTDITYIVDGDPKHEIAYYDRPTMYKLVADSFVKKWRTFDSRLLEYMFKVPYYVAEFLKTLEIPDENIREYAGGGDEEIAFELAYSAHRQGDWEFVLGEAAPHSYLDTPDDGFVLRD